MTTSRISPAGAAATVAAALVVIAGLVVVGAPSRARERRLDQMRVDDLNSLSIGIDEYWSKNTALPVATDSLVSAHQLDKVPTDPASRAPYSYLVSGERSYRLCATFAQPSDTAASADVRDWTLAIGARHSHSWRHGAGESCFDLTPPAKDLK
ncbi:MAG: hypothetical protein H0U66_17780 [Gemmatimonadaceae bacterium]|nr:hypothetical protein [Gemmatimonadaceae bacterium]